MRRKLFRGLLRAELDNASIASALIGAMIVVAMVVAAGFVIGTLPPMFT